MRVLAGPLELVLRKPALGSDADTAGTVGDLRAPAGIRGDLGAGPRRAFLESGTRNLLVTLWPVEVGAARDFALAFHKALATGKSPSRAAVAARDELRDHGTPMADWAAFRLVGRD